MAITKLQGIAFVVVIGTLGLLGSVFFTSTSPSVVGDTKNASRSDINNPTLSPTQTTSSSTNSPPPSSSSTKPKVKSNSTRVYKEIKGKRIISYGLHDNIPRNIEGALKNIELAKLHFPEWKCRFYMDASVTSENRNKIIAAGGEIFDIDRKEVGILGRFLVAGDPEVEVYIIRDTDTRLSRRERAAIEHWLDNGESFHLMRDHPHFTAPMYAGLWGGRRSIHNIRSMITNFRDRNFVNSDITFVQANIWPVIQEELHHHDSFTCVKTGGLPFPTMREGTDYIGQKFDENGAAINTMNETEALSQALPEPRECRTLTCKGEKPWIVLGIPMATYGEPENLTIEDLPFWNYTLPSFFEHTVIGSAQKFCMSFILGYDVGDPKLDNEYAVSEIKRIFYEQVQLQYLTQEIANEWSENALTVELLRINGTKGAPSWAVTEIMLTGYRQGADYFYQLNDDTVMMTDNWADIMVGLLVNNPTLPNYGITGPKDLKNLRLLTHSFAHRTHLDIFNRWFPIRFKNWWSDDWLTVVYGPKNTFRNHTVTIEHQVHRLRYKADRGSGGKVLSDEIAHSREVIKRWILNRFLPS